MDEQRSRHAVATVPGALALATWSVYVLLAAFFYYPVLLPSVLTTGLVGLLAGLAVLVNFTRWRLVVILASVVYLAFYAVRVARMVGMVMDAGTPSISSAVSLYYNSLWIVNTGVFLERGTAAGLTHGILEYAMPVLSLALIVVTLMSRRPQRGASVA